MCEISEERTYYIRTSLMYTDLTREVLFKVFKYLIKSDDITGFLSSLEQQNKLRELLQRHVLNQPDYSLVSSQVLNLERFDISLLVRLVLNLCKDNIPKPQRGWETKPNPKDESLGADLLRLRDVRNKIIGHSADAKLSVAEYEKMWAKIKAILLRVVEIVDSQSSENFEQRINEYKRLNVDKENAEVKRLLDELLNYKTEFDLLQEKVEELSRRSKEFQEYFKITPEIFVRYIKLLFDGGRIVLCGMMMTMLGDQDLLDFLERKKETLIRNIDEKYSSCLYSQASCSDYKKWDVYLLASILLLTFDNDLSQKEIMNIERIKSARVNYAALAFQSLDAVDFLTNWTDLIICLKDLSSNIAEDDKLQVENLIERYKNKDEGGCDAEEYLKQLRESGVAVKTLNDVYNETIKELRDMLNQLSQKDFKFGKGFVFEFKLLTICENEEIKKEAEDLLEINLQASIQKSDQPSGPIRKETDKVVAIIAAHPDVTPLELNRKCIIWSFKCSTPGGLLHILDVTDGDQFRNTFRNIAYEMHYIYGYAFLIQGKYTFESVSMVSRMINKSTNYEASSEQISIPLKCSSLDGISSVLSVIKQEKTTNSLNRIAEHMSAEFKETVSIKLIPEMMEFQNVFEETDSEGSSSLGRNEFEIEELVPVKIDKTEKHADDEKKEVSAWQQFYEEKMNEYAIENKEPEGNFQTIKDTFQTIDLGQNRIEDVILGEKRTKSELDRPRKEIETLLKCQDVTFRTEIENEIKDIDESPVSVSSVLSAFAQDSRIAQTVADRIRELEVSMTDIYSSTHEQLSNIYARVEKQPISTAEAVQNILQKDTPRKEIETLLKQTEAVLKRKSEYVFTQQFYEIEKLLMSSASVVISGGAGEGKTYAAYEIMRRNGQGNNCIQIHSPDDVRFVDPRIVDFVFIDDIFGNHDVDESKLQTWVQVMEQLQQLVNAKAIRLIIATREIVLKKCKKKLEKFSIFNNTFSLSSRNLSLYEKKEILTLALNKKKKRFSSEEIQRCVTTFSSDLGFPYTCVLFASDECFFNKGASFFKHNPFLNFDVFKALNDCKKLSLLFIWIKDGTWPGALKRGSENDEVLKKISHMLNYDHAIDVLYDQVNKHCKIMDGVFVNAGSYGYQFTHNMVYQAIGHFFAKIGFCDLILEYSNLAFFMECISVTEDHYRSDRVFIRRNFYQNLVDRIITEVIGRNHYREMAMHPCLTNEILEILVKTLKKKKKLKDFFFSGICFSSSMTEYSISNTFLSYYLETCAAESCLFLKQLQGQLKCSKLLHKRKCKICYLYKESYHGACRGGNIEALKLLTFVQCDSSILLDAAHSGSISMYKYIHKLLDPEKRKRHETQALFIAVEHQDSEMYTVIRNLGCRPNSECLLKASKAKNSELLVNIIFDMYVSHALNKDKNVKYAQRTLFSMDVLEAFILVGMCPTKEDIVRSMSLDMKAVESILWDLKYKVREKERNINEHMIELWKNVMEDQDLKEKLEEIGLLDTYSYLDQQVIKGNSEKVEHIIQHLKRKKDWDATSLFACNLLSLSLPKTKNMFEYLLNLGVIPNYTILLKSVATGDKSIVKMTLDKMKAADMFDPLHKGSKQALLQSTLTCDIYNSLIDEGMDPKAYHFRYVVETDIDTETKIKIINNLYSMVEKCNCLHRLDKKTMQLALLGAFDNTDVYTCLLKQPFKLQSSVLPVIVSRGSVSQVKRLISNLKEQEDWPPLFESIELSLECSFYMPSIFAVLMEEISVENSGDQNKILPYQILLECRGNSFHKIEKYISIMKHNNLWDPKNVILKCSLLESSHDQATLTLFEDNGVVADDILDTVYEIGNFEMQSYIIAYLSRKGQQINLNDLNEDIIKSLSSVPSLCSGHMLRRAVDVSDNEVVLKIFKTLNNTDPYFIKSEFASDVLELSSKRLDIYTSLFEKGFIPTIKCLLNLIKNGSFTLFHNTMKSLNALDKLDLTDELERNLVQESTKRDSARFYLSLSEYGIKAHFEDLISESNSKNLSVCHLLVNDIEKDILEKCPDGIDVVISHMFPLYKQMREKGLQLKPPTLLKLTQLFQKGQISVSNILTIMKDYFSCQNWSFDDKSLSEVYELSKGNKDLFSILDVYYKSEIESHLLNALMQRDAESIKEYLKQNSDDAKRVLPDVIRKALITRKRLDKGCTQLIYEWIEHSHCDPSLRILSSVLYSDTENTLEILLEMSEQTKATLDNDVLQTALEEAIYYKKTGLYLSILKECRVKPTTYCLLHSLRHNNDVCFKLTLKKLPGFRKSCHDPYYKTSLALCCQNSELDKFKALLEKCKICDTELLFEAVLCKNEHIFQLVKENLIKQDQWDFSLQEYWIASAFIEAEDNPLIKCQFESYYDDTVNGRDIMVYENTVDEEPNDEDNDDNKSENEYEDLDNFIFREKAYWPLKHIQRDNF